MYELYLVAGLRCACVCVRVSLSLLRSFGLSSLSLLLHPLLPLLPLAWKVHVLRIAGKLSLLTLLTIPGGVG